jgi:hypothetical protein
MIRKNVKRFSEKIGPNKKLKRDDDSSNLIALWQPDPGAFPRTPGKSQKKQQN